MPRKSANPLAEKIVELRTQQGWSQTELSNRLGYQVSHRTVQRAEAGEPVSVSVLQKIAQILGVELATIVDADEPVDELGEEYELVTLVSTLSGREVMKIIPNSADNFRFTFNVDPETEKDAEPYVEMVRLLESLSNELATEKHDTAFPVRAAAQLNQAKKKIEEVGGKFFAGDYEYRSYGSCFMDPYDEVEGTQVDHQAMLAVQFDDTQLTGSIEREFYVGRNLKAHREWRDCHLRENLLLDSNSLEDSIEIDRWAGRL